MSEQEFLAGFPVRNYYAVTGWRSTHPFGVAVVDGFPVREVSAPGAETDPAARHDSPWRLVYGRGLRARRNRIEPRQDLQAGDAVLLGGFFPPRGGMTSVDYAEVPPSVITGWLIAIPPAGVSESPLHWVLVPPGDYQSFLGGPAASQTASEGLRVWGAVAEVFPLLHGPWSFGTLLAVAKLSPDFGSGAASGS